MSLFFVFVIFHKVWDCFSICYFLQGVRLFFSICYFLQCVRLIFIFVISMRCKTFVCLLFPCLPLTSILQRTITDPVKRTRYFSHKEVFMHVPLIWLIVYLLWLCTSATTSGHLFWVDFIFTSLFLLEIKFKDTNWVIRSCKSMKDKQYNCQKKITQDKQRSAKHYTDRVPWTPLKTELSPGAPVFPRGGWWIFVFSYLN